MYLNKEKTTSIFSSPTSDLPNYESQPRTIENQTTSSTSYSINTNNPSLIPENSINQIIPNINQNIQNISIQEIYEQLASSGLAFAEGLLRLGFTISSKSVLICSSRQAAKNLTKLFRKRK